MYQSCVIARLETAFGMLYCTALSSEIAFMQDLIALTELGGFSRSSLLREDIGGRYVQPTKSEILRCSRDDEEGFRRQGTLSDEWEYISYTHLFTSSKRASDYRFSKAGLDKVRSRISKNHQRRTVSRYL